MPLSLHPVVRLPDHTPTQNGSHEPRPSAPPPPHPPVAGLYACDERPSRLPSLLDTTNKFPNHPNTGFVLESAASWRRRWPSLSGLSCNSRPPHTSLASSTSPTSPPLAA